MIKIAVVSGKGGTGKSVVTSSLAYELSKKYHLLLIDTDVDCPNQYLLFKGKKKFSKHIKAAKIAVVGNRDCIKCEKCKNVCQFGAISIIKGKLTINSMKCEGCGACVHACPENLIKLYPKLSGEILVSITDNFPLVYGKLIPGGSVSGKIVFEARKKGEEIAIKENRNIILVDSAAGIGCPVIASITGCDYVVGVVEPTQTSIKNLERALEVASHFRIPYSIVINKIGISKKYEEEIEKKFYGKIIGRIPYDREIPFLLSKGIVPISMEKIQSFNALISLVNSVENIINKKTK